MTIVQDLLKQLDPREYIHPMGSYEEKDKIIMRIQEIVESDTSHIILGSYTIGNFIDNPNNMLIVREGIILNVRAKNEQIIVFGNPTSEDKEFLYKLLYPIRNYFAFISGSRLLELFETFDFYDRKLKNTVFILGEFKKLKSENTFVIHKELNSHLSQKLINFHRYDDMSSDALEVMFQSKVHCVKLVNDQIVSSARTNSFSDAFAIIGGVYTKPEHRRKGYSKEVNSNLVEYLQQHTKTIALETDNSNSAAIRVYEKLGYEKVGVSAFYERDISFIQDVLIGDRDY